MYIQNQYQSNLNGQSFTRKTAVAASADTEKFGKQIQQRLFGDASTTEISDIGKQLQKNAKREREKGEAQKRCDSLEAAAKDRQEKYGIISDLENQLKNDNLTEADKKEIADQIAQLKEDIKTPQEKLNDNINTLAKQKSDLQKQADKQGGTATTEFDQKIAFCLQQIAESDARKKQLYMRDHGVEVAALQEEAAKVAEEMKAALMGTKEEEVLGSKELPIVKLPDKIAIEKITEEETKNEAEDEDDAEHKDDKDKTTSGAADLPPSGNSSESHEI